MKEKRHTTQSPMSPQPVALCETPKYDGEGVTVGGCGRSGGSWENYDTRGPIYGGGNFSGGTTDGRGGYGPENLRHVGEGAIMGMANIYGTGHGGG